jgi:hypothetical protein
MTQQVFRTENSIKISRELLEQNPAQLIESLKSKLKGDHLFALNLVQVPAEEVKPFLYEPSSIPEIHDLQVKLAKLYTVSDRREALRQWILDLPTGHFPPPTKRNGERRPRYAKDLAPIIAEAKTWIKELEPLARLLMGDTLVNLNEAKGYYKFDTTLLSTWIRIGILKKVKEEKNRIFIYEKDAVLFAVINFRFTKAGLYTVLRCAFTED